MTLRFRHALFVSSLMIFGCAASPARQDPKPSQNKVESVANEQVIKALKAELERTSSKLKFKDYQAPYFVSYQLKDVEQRGFTAKFGSIMSRDNSRNRYVYAEVRVGDYGFDNFANIDNEAFRMSELTVDRRAPLDDDAAALRGVLWQISDFTYKKALSDFLTKKGGAVYATDAKVEVPSFSKEKPQTHRGPATSIVFDEVAWAGHARAISSQMLKSKNVLDSSMDVGVNRTTRYLVNSEGADIIDEITIYSIQLSASTRADDGMLLENGRSFYARTPQELPSLKTLEQETTLMLTELEALRQAPVIDPYTGPAILLPEASGVLFHEAVGHRLEGERQRDEEEGRTFKGRVDKVVIPAFISVYDDPTLTSYGKIELNGHYLFDDEGVKAQRVPLIEAGVLKGFLKSRTPIEGSAHSNGHGRAQGIQKPMARMANLIVEASPDKRVPYEQLKQMLMEEARRQKKPFGLIIKDITGGSTNTSGYGYQAFKGSSRQIYKVDPETGAETLVRGAEIVGTPLISINKIVAASKETGVFNGYCGAESGYVPVSTAAPALLTTELELQRNQSGTERSPLLPAPWLK